MSRLDYPAARAPAGVADLLGEFLAAAADVRLESLGGHELARMAVVIAAVQAQALGSLLGRDRARDRAGGQRRLKQRYVVTVSAVLREPDRDARGLAKDRTFRPFFALSVGLGPVAGPPKGALVVAPSTASHDQSIPIFSS